MQITSLPEVACVKEAKRMASACASGALVCGIVLLGDGLKRVAIASRGGQAMAIVAKPLEYLFSPTTRIQ